MSPNHNILWFGTFDGTVFIHSLDGTEIYLGPKQYPRLTSRVFCTFMSSKSATDYLLKFSSSYLKLLIHYLKNRDNFHPRRLKILAGLRFSSNFVKILITHYLKVQEFLCSWWVQLKKGYFWYVINLLMNRLWSFRCRFTIFNFNKNSYKTIFTAAIFTTLFLFL